jgi:hypothetical protein
MNKPVLNLTAFAGSSPPWNLASLDADIAALQACVNDLGTYSNPLADGGTVNAIVVTTATGLTATYEFGLLLYVKIANTTTSTAVTIDLDALGTVTVLLPNGSAPPVGAFVANGVYGFIYDGTNFQAQTASVSSLLASNNTWTGANTFTPGSGVAITINGVASTICEQINSANGSSATADLVVARTSVGIANALSAGANIALGSTVNNGTSLQNSGGQTELWQANGGIWQQYLRISSTGALGYYGPAAGSIVDLTPDSNGFPLTPTGVSAGGPYTCSWYRVGKLVMLAITNTNTVCTSNSTSFTATGLPAELQPATLTQHVGIPIEFLNGGAFQAAEAVIAPGSGTVTFWVAGGATNWVSSSTKGIPNGITIVLPYLLY